MFQGLSMHLANEIANTCGTQEQLVYAKSCQKDIFLDNFENDFANVMQRQDHSKGESQLKRGCICLGSRDHFRGCILCMLMFSSFVSQGLSFKEFAMQVKKCIFVTGFAMRAEKCTIVTEFVLLGPKYQGVN